MENALTELAARLEAAAAQTAAWAPRNDTRAALGERLYHNPRPASGPVLPGTHPTLKD